MQFVCAVLLAGVLFTAPATARPRGTVSAQTSGSCVSSGYSGGCCTVGSCYASTGQWQKGCYCDETCFASGDCCSDIADIGCEDPAAKPAMNCTAAGLSPGCCQPTLWASCRPSPSAHCLCDSLCFAFGDCCTDVVSVSCNTPTSQFGRQKTMNVQTQRNGGGRQGGGRLGASEDTTAQLLDAVLALAQRLNTAAAATQQKHMK